MHIGTVREIAAAVHPRRARWPPLAHASLTPRRGSPFPRAHGRKSAPSREPRAANRRAHAGPPPAVLRSRPPPRNLRTRADASERDGTHREASARRSGSETASAPGPARAPTPQTLRPLTPALSAPPSPERALSSQANGGTRRPRSAPSPTPGAASAPASIRIPNRHPPPRLRAAVRAASRPWMARAISGSPPPTHPDPAAGNTRRRRTPPT